MPTYFFHLGTPDGLIPDERGMELANLDAVREEALASARAIISEFLRNGGIVHGYAFTVADDRGEQEMMYDFKNLLEANMLIDS